MKLCFALLAAFASCTAFATGMAARESVPREPVAPNAKPTADASPFAVHGYGTFDVLSGYEFRGALLNDEPVYWTYGELCAAYADLVSVGGWLAQSTDMTCRRKAEMRRMNEWDFAANTRICPELAEGWKLGLEAGHCWCCMHGLRGEAARAYSRPATEIYAILWLENPYAVPYATCEYGYDAFEGTAFSFGLRRAFALPLGLELVPKVCAGGSDAGYNATLYPPFDDSVGTGLTFVQVGAELNCWVTENFGVRAQASFSAVIDPDIRDAIDACGHPYRNEFVCGGLGVVFAF